MRHQGIVLGGAWLSRYSLHHKAAIVGPAIYIEGLDEPSLREYWTDDEQRFAVLHSSF